MADKSRGGKVLDEIEANLAGVYTRVSNFISMLLGHVHSLIDAMLVTIKRVISRPGLLLSVIVGVLVVIDLYVLGKLGIINYLIASLKLIFEILSDHIKALLILIGSFIFITFLVKEIKK